MFDVPSKIHIVWTRLKTGGPWEALFVDEVPRGMLLIRNDHEFKHAAYKLVPVPEAQRYVDASGKPTGTSEVAVIDEGSMGKKEDADADCG